MAHIQAAFGLTRARANLRDSGLGRPWVGLILVLLAVLLCSSARWHAAGRAAAEQAALTVAYRGAMAKWQLPGAPQVVDLKDRRTLVVGDSMVLAWPWPADRIALAGQATPVIRARFADAVRGRSYDRIVLWAGTAHFVGGNDVGTYREDLLSMVALAQSHSRTVVVIGPFPARRADYGALRRAEQSIRRAEPELPFVSLVEVHEDLVELQALDRVSRDGLHLSRAATAMLLGPRLAGVPPPATAGRPAA